MAQERSNDAFVDESGVIRYISDKEEIHGFGVNYTVPFAHAYRSAKRMGLSVKQLIDQDVYHFSRLGFDLYRIHVWDTEISDTEGNLIENEHLDAFDYLLKKLTEYDINYVITPIAYWGNGWPEPDEQTPGFSHKYGKGDCLTNEDCIAAQKTYLKQFLNHTNPYKGISYKNDPNLIAFEISNEPHHSGEADKVTRFVEQMVNAMKGTGTRKPIFYNISHGVHFVNAYFEAGIDGGTFQWYPTGLGYQRPIPGNVLPNVSEYDIPFDKDIKRHQGAKIVYEFDAADVAESHVYPAMARSFREAGIQLATHFAYDPTFLAPFNTEYDTHYMNLLYTPKKALALKISSAIFHEVPLYSDFGDYPENNSFGNVEIDKDHDLAVYRSSTAFYYTNSTEHKPKDTGKLQHIAGYGNSVLVEYDGLGAYFLDKIAPGLWRLEVLPDAIRVDNPFGSNSLDKKVGVLAHNERNLKINLKDLGTDFRVEPINPNNTFTPRVEEAEFTVRPGTYMLTKQGFSGKWSPNDSFGNTGLDAYFGPDQAIEGEWFLHEPFKEASLDQDLLLKARYVSNEKPVKIELRGFNGQGPIRHVMNTKNAYDYEITIPSSELSPGPLTYNIVVSMEDGTQKTYPHGYDGSPGDWDYTGTETYSTMVLPGEYPLSLFEAKEDYQWLVRQWRNGFRLVPLEQPNEAAYEMNIERLFVPDNENLNAPPIYDYSFKHYLIDRIKGRKGDLKDKEKVVFKGYSLNGKPCKLQIAFVMDNGSSYGSTIELKPGAASEYSIDLIDLAPVRTVTLPRPYPSFLPYYFTHNNPEGFDINKIESIQFSIGPGIAKDKVKDKHGIGLVSVRLE
ncbi:glycoside hydrolase 5 family protein [Flagellimonas crocea]|uniref:cellulase family glycosylhydrolase n=1 Tax=Flagellimonas crocea TaxID=3067311 RepID=UPI00296F8B94|nr:cellulase family glycosylhydrolase [Muricauda sp. DH64]